MSATAAARPLFRDRVHDGAADPAPGSNTRRSTIQVAELVLGLDGRLACDRDAPARIRLVPPR